MADEVLVPVQEEPQRRVYLEEIDIGDEAIDPRVRARRFGTKEKTVRGDHFRKRPEVGKPARISIFGRIAADSLIEVSLEIISSRFLEHFASHCGICPEHLVCRLLLEKKNDPERIGHQPIKI